MGTKQAEAARDKMTSITDADTLAANNGSGPVSTESYEGQNASVLNGTNVDFDAPITKAQLSANKARKGRKAGEYLKDKDLAHIQQAIDAITDKTDDDGNITSYATDDDELTFVFQHKNNQHKAYRQQIEDAATRMAPFKLIVVFSKHNVSPHTYSTKADDADNDLIYMFTIGRVEYTTAETAESE